jgi:hypothetical protein
MRYGAALWLGKKLSRRPFTWLTSHLAETRWHSNCVTSQRSGANGRQ